MKRIISIVAICTSLSSFAQWSTADASNNIHNTNTGNVGINTTNLSDKLTVNGNVYLPDFDNAGSISRYVRVAAHLFLQSTDNGNNSWLRSVIGSNLLWDNPNNRWQT